MFVKKMFKNLICLILIIKLTAARFGYVPRFYGENSAIIVDTDKLWLMNSNNKALNYANKVRLPAPFPLWRHYPRYRILPPPPPLPLPVLAINTWSKTKPTKPLTTTMSNTIPSTTSTTPTTSPITFTTTVLPISSIATPLPLLTDDEFPKELLDIAQNKLGLKSLDEIPSLSELGQLLGTNTPKETLNYIQQLTSNDEGIALMKAYIESADYTDSSGNLNGNKNDANDYYADEIGDIDETFKLNDEDLVVINDDDLNDDYNVYGKTTTLKPKNASKTIQKLKELPKTHHASFMERIANFMHLNNLFDKPAQKEETQTQNENNNVISRTEISKDKLASKDDLLNQTEAEITEPKRVTYRNSILNASLLETESKPFNNPVPIRVESSTAPTITTTVGNNTSVVHLNTPKILIPHVQKLAHVTKLPTKEIENFLANKPKLLELATKVSRFPLGYDRNSPMEAQVMSVVQKAIEQDDDLRKLLNSTATLK